MFAKAMQWLGLQGAPDPGELTDKARNDMLTELAEPEKQRLDGYARFERYYEGEHNVRLTDRERQYLQRSGLPFAENFCETVVDAFAHRLNITAMTCEDNEAAAEWADDFFGGDAIAEVAGTIHNQTPLKGDGFLGIEFDADTGAPAFHWNDPGCCIPVYNASGQLLMVAKTWSEAAPSRTNPDGRHVRRLNLYLADRVEKWFTYSGTGQAQWMMHMDLADEGWPVPWVRKDGTPRGVGIIHFRHKPKGKDFGRSRLRSVIPQQDYLNKQLIDLANVLDNQGWAQRWATGVSPKTAGTLKNVAGELWASPNENAKFGQFDAAEVRGVLEAIEATLKRIAGRSNTPLHLLFAGAITQLPSGESLKTSESALVAEVKDAHPTYGLNWSRAVSIAASLEADYGSTGLAYAGEAFETNWQDPVSRNESTELEVAEAKSRIGVSQTTLLEEAGYDPAVEAERRKDEALENQRNFDAGLGGEDPNPDNEGTEE